MLSKIELSRLLNNKIRGNTIMEVLIALVILSFCLALASIIYLNLQKSSAPFFKIKGVEIAERIVYKTIDDKQYVDEVLKVEEFTVKKTVTSHPIFNDCVVLHLIVTGSSQSRLCDMERIIYNGR